MTPLLTTASRVAELGPWFHNIQLPDGTQTAPNHFLGSDFPGRKWREIAAHLPEDLSGWTTLDIGCNAGYYSLELAKRGAQVTAVDVNPFYLNQARYACEQFGLQDRITFEQTGVYEIGHEASLRTFDLVLFLGVFYHLRYPILALDIVAERVKRLLVFQTLTMPGMEITPSPEDMDMDHREAMEEPGWPKIAFIEKRLCGDPTNWWAPNHAGILAMLRSCGLRPLVNPAHEIYIAEPDPERPSVMMTWNRWEYDAAIGKK